MRERSEVDKHTIRRKKEREENERQKERGRGKDKRKSSESNWLERHDALCTQVVLSMRS